MAPATNILPPPSLVLSDPGPPQPSQPAAIYDKYRYTVHISDMQPLCSRIELHITNMQPLCSRIELHITNLQPLCSHLAAQITLRLLIWSPCATELVPISPICSPYAAIEQLKSAVCHRHEASVQHNMVPLPFP